MYYLIKKDLLVQKYNLLISLLIVLTFTIAFANLGPVGLSLSIFAVSYILFLLLVLSYILSLSFYKKREF